MIILTVPPAAPPPATRPGGFALEVGDIWIRQNSGERHRHDGTAWQPFSPVIIHNAAAPSTRLPSANPLQPEDVWIQTASRTQYRYDGTAWKLAEPPAGIVPAAGAAERFRHLAQIGTAPFQTGFVEATEGIVYLHEQRTASPQW